jgi:hypothetical protein
LAQCGRGVFATLTKRRLKRGVFRSIVELQAAINRFLAEHNCHPRPFQWTESPKKIIAAVKRGFQVLDSNHKVQGVAGPVWQPAPRYNRTEELATQVLPSGIGFEWTEIAYQQQQKGTPTMLEFGGAALFVFLVLAANYESWKLPLSAVLIVPMCLLPPSWGCCSVVCPSTSSRE